MLGRVQQANQAGLLVQPAENQRAGAEQLDQLVADEIDDGLEVELGGHAFLDAVDDGELVRALLDEGVRGLQFLGALRDLLLEALRPLGVVECHGGLAREHAQEVAVRFTEPSEGAVEVGVEVAQQLPLRDQRRDDARPLLQFARALGAIRETDRTRPAHVHERRRDVPQQRLRILAARHERARQLQAVRRVQHQQHALGAAQFRRFVDQEIVQFVGAAQLVQAQSRVHQPLERLAQVCFAGEMGRPPLRRQAALARVLEPRLDDFAVLVDLVEIVATESFVAQAGAALQHELIRHRERLARGQRLLVRAQRLRVSPPGHGGRHAIERSQVVRTVQLRGAPRRRQRGARIAQRQARLSDASQRVDLRGDAGTVVGEPPRALEMTQRFRGLTLAQGKPTLRGRQGGSDEGMVVCFCDARRPGDVRTRTVEMSHGEFHLGERAQQIRAPAALQYDRIGPEQYQQEQAAGVPVQPELTVSDAEVEGDDLLAFDIAGALEIGECQAKLLQPDRVISFVEREHVEGIARAIEVTAAPTELQRAAGGAVGLGGATKIALCRGEHPLCTSMPRSVAQCLEQLGRPGRVGDGLFGQILPHLRLGEAKQAHRDRVASACSDARP